MREGCRSGEGGRQTLKPVSGVNSIIFDPLLIRIGQRIQNHEDEDIETHIGRVLQNLNDHPGEVVVCHDLIDGISEEDARVRMGKLGHRSGEAVDSVVR
jgi:hypothetical protein